MGLYLGIRVNVQLLTLICSLFVVCAIVRELPRSFVIWNIESRGWENDGIRLTILLKFFLFYPLVLKIIHSQNATR